MSIRERVALWQNGEPYKVRKHLVEVLSTVRQRKGLQPWYLGVHQVCF